MMDDALGVILIILVGCIIWCCTIVICNDHNDYTYIRSISNLEPSQIMSEV